MSTEITPVAAQTTVSQATFTVTSSYSGAGAALAFATVSTELFIENIGAWGVQLRVDAGAWVTIDARKSVTLNADASQVTLTARKAEFAGASTLRITARSQPGQLVAGDDNVAAGGGATAYADLTDVDVSTPPEDGQVPKWDSGASKWIPAADNTGGGGGLPDPATPNAAVRVNSAGDALTVEDSPHVVMIDGAPAVAYFAPVTWLLNWWTTTGTEGNLTVDLSSDSAYGYSNYEPGSPPVNQFTPQEGDSICVLWPNDETDSGVFVLGSLTNPAAVPLTRRSDMPLGLVLKEHFHFEVTNPTYASGYNEGGAHGYPLLTSTATNRTSCWGLAYTDSGALTTTLGAEYHEFAWKLEGSYSTAVGHYSTATGNDSIAIGPSSATIGDYSSAIGVVSIASGDYSIALGYYASASGAKAVAIGYQADATNGDMVLKAAANLHLQTTQAVVATDAKTGTGIKINTASPEWGWRDIIGNVQPKASGAGSPARAAYAGANVGQYAFALNDVCDFEFHIPHDYVPGTDLHFHVHWSHNDNTSITGNAVFTAYFTYAKGHNQANFPAEKTTTITYATTNLTTTPQYRHRIDEVAITAATADGTHFDRDDIEIDGLVLLTLKLTGIPTFGGTGKLFIHTCDLHYQSTNLGTHDKAPNFYVT